MVFSITSVYLKNQFPHTYIYMFHNSSLLQLPMAAGFGDTITFVGGINKPKLVECMDGRGHKYRQLVKSGQDDLRQDAVMQQFFDLVNSLLAGSASAAKRQLGITTYKVCGFTVPNQPVGMLRE